MESVKINGEIPLIIGYVEREAKTKDLVQKVYNLKCEHPELVETIIKAIGSLVEEARKALHEGDLVRAGELMNINHGLLDALGVSTKKLSELVYAARAMGALGSKLSGAGGGGSMIALASKEKIAEVASAIKILGGRVIDTTIGGEGLVYEKIEK